MDAFGLAEQTFDDVVRHLPLYRLERMSENMTWSERIGDDECQFEVVVLENTAEYVHVSVDVSYCAADGSGFVPNSSVAFDDILKKPQGERAS